MGATLSKLSSVTSRNSLRSDFPNTVPSSMPSPTSSPPSSPIRSIPWRQSRSGRLSHEKPITRVIYSQFEVQRGLPVQMLMRYFRKEDTSWRINDAIRAMAQFREFNLLSDLRSLGRFDIVFCRNVLIYFDQPTKSRVLGSIAGTMSPDGMLYL